jgi:hypothetical protein
MEETGGKRTFMGEFSGARSANCEVRGLCCCCLLRRMICVCGKSSRGSITQEEGSVVNCRDGKGGTGVDSVVVALQQHLVMTINM